MGCVGCKGGSDVEGLVKERGRAQLWEHGGAAAECQGCRINSACTEGPWAWSSSSAASHADTTPVNVFVG